MSILVVGLNYRRVPVDVLERLAFDGESLPKGLHQLRAHEHLREAAILSTCNRVEIYALASGFHAGVAALRTFLSALFRQAIRVGRRARSETGIARSAGTLAAAGLQLARAALGRLSGRTILILGAGKMSDLAASTIAAEGARVMVANRTPSRAAAVAQRIGGEA